MSPMDHKVGFCTFAWYGFSFWLCLQCVFSRSWSPCHGKSLQRLTQACGSQLKQSFMHLWIHRYDLGVPYLVHFRIDDYTLLLLSPLWPIICTFALRSTLYSLLIPDSATNLKDDRYCKRYRMIERTISCAERMFVADSILEIPLAQSHFRCDLYFRILWAL